MRLNEIREPGRSHQGQEAARPRHWLGLGQDVRAGVKGQKAATGVAIKGFEGGQMPLIGACRSAASTTSSPEVQRAQSRAASRPAVDSGLLDGKEADHHRCAEGSGPDPARQGRVCACSAMASSSEARFRGDRRLGTAIKAVEAAGGTVTLKSITGREARRANAIKAKKRADKRDAYAAKAKEVGKAKASQHG
jgi:large subunit ribosomal protein L15